MTPPYPTIPGVTFKDCPGFPGYCVGDDGTVWSCQVTGHSYPKHVGPWRRLKEGVNRKRYNYLLVAVRDANGKRYTRSVHRLVLEAFVGPKPPGMEGCHFPDPDPANNRLSNLRWDTPRANSVDSLVLGRRQSGVRSSVATLDASKIEAIFRLRSEGCSQKEIALKLGTRKHTVGRVLQGKTYRQETAKTRRLHASRLPKRVIPPTSLDDADVETIRGLRRDGWLNRQIADTFGVNVTTISLINRGLWRPRS